MHIFLYFITKSIFLWLYSHLLGLGLFFLQFLKLFTQSGGLLGWGSQGRYLHTGQQKQNKRTQTSMPQVVFEPMIPVLERAKTVHARPL
jgi:hypothetical protein